MSQIFNNRDTRVQTVIIENGKYILLEHLAIKENKSFWGLPGGGREPGESDEEAAFREAKEETGLDINLLPVKHEVLLPEKKFIYSSIVTFAAYPVSGEAQTGYEPEAQVFKSYNYKLTGLKWQDFYKDDGLTGYAKKSIEPIRELLKSAPFKQKAGVIAYRMENGQIKFLMNASKKHPHYLVFHQGRVKKENTPEEIAGKKIREILGYLNNSMKPEGFFFHENDGEFYRTEMFSLMLPEEITIPENNEFHWIESRQALRYNLFRETREYILELSKL